MLKHKCVWLAVVLLACGPTEAEIREIVQEAVETTPTPTVEPEALPTRAPLSVEEVVKRALPTIIRVRSMNGMGTGVIYHVDDKWHAWAITNAHIVGEVGASLSSAHSADDWFAWHGTTARMVLPEFDLGPIDNC